jgi:hypothetical protein
MSNAFTNFLGGVASGVFGTGPIVKDFQHANRLYVQNTYARAPKLGFLYFVSFDINTSILPTNSAWAATNYTEVGLLAKRAELPKFSISYETVNQYNRKSLVSTQIKYNPVSIELHDDNSNITRDLWKTYFQYYIKDSTYNTNGHSVPTEFTDTKYNENSYQYGLNGSQTIPFFRAIHIYVMHQQKFTQYTLVNPIITDWSHDSVSQEEGSKTLSNKMTVSYETVLYNEGSITRRTNSGATIPEFTATYYDKSPSPLSVAGNGTNTLLGSGGVISGASSVLGALASGNILGAAILGANVARNVRQLSKAGLKQEGYSILTGALGDIQATGNQPGGIGSAVQSGINQRGIGVNIFSNNNTSINGTTQASQVKTIK